MPRAKEEVMGYADDVYLMWLRNHIDYIKSIVEHLEGIYSVYLEIKQDANSDFGWIASDEFIEAMNEMKKYLDKIFADLLQHQKTIISGKLLWNEIKNQYEKEKKKADEEKKNSKREEVDPSFQ
ncbi:MAG: hypothetical protein FHOMOCKG_00093 [Methanophagales virus GBV302]|uniref:Uncharacterized protein n=1 Tax=Methanophagales virus GBV302 TaxID=2999281 RepID=A0A9E8VDN5_9CAUD|nr:MAG: hypothetical protein QIT37_gp093 [Methanophagales virus GBV302]WAE39621.1 MAG: hypothetical protein FHOMOCKG_00093 [Methanophagales virus GBV302]